MFFFVFSCLCVFLFWSLPVSEEHRFDPSEFEMVEGRAIDLVEFFGEGGNIAQPREDHRSGFVAVIGRPNVGKSTFLNRVLGQKIAIVSSKPQTTRDQILGIYTGENAQIIFLDTPGIHNPKNKLGKRMVQVAEESVARDADIALWLVDVNTPPTDEDRMIAERLHTLHQITPLPLLLIGFNKIDEWHKSDELLQQRAAEYRALLEWLIDEEDEDSQAEMPIYPISAATGQGMDDLLADIREFMPEGPSFYPNDQVTNLNLRFLVTEAIREQALNLLHQEVPHSIAVAVTDWEERDENMTYIAATIYVERHSQKGIVLGQKGSMIKQLGQAARPHIEELVGTKVYLELWVKVLEKWRAKENLLQRLGYT
jgi:GTP-binding protein Era